MSPTGPRVNSRPDVTSRSPATTAPWRRSEPSAWTPPRVACSWPIPARPAVNAASWSARSSRSGWRTPSSRRGACNAMARLALRRVGSTEEAGRRRLAHLDLDRSMVDAARVDPARFEALYRKYLAQVYSYAYYELRDHHEAEDATERTFLAALTNLQRFEERARPADGEGASTFRVWLFRIARNVVAERRRVRRRHPEAPLEAAGDVADDVDIVSQVTGSRRGRGGLAGRVAADRRSASGGHPAVRRRDVDGGDRRDPRAERRRRPRPHPSRAAQPGRGPRWA